MSTKCRKFISSAFTSLVFAYTLYVYALQTPTFLSRSRLVIALFIGGGFFLLLWWASSRSNIFTLPDKQTQWGMLSLFIFLNLFLLGFLSNIPYTYGFLPTQSVVVSPTPAGSGQEPVRITSFDTELVKGISLSNFAENDGWQTQGKTIFQENDWNGALIWHGKPGNYVEITLEGCHDCGNVEISWDGGQPQMVDRLTTGQEWITVKHEFGSLGWHKTFNFLMLEIAALLMALLATNICIWFFRKPELTKPRSNSEPVYLSRFSPYIGLGALTVVSYVIKFQPVLFNDDWCLIYRLHIGDIHGFAMGDRRPLQWIIPWIFSRFLPYEQMITATYIVQIVILFSSAALLFLLVRRLLKGGEWFAFLVAVLYLVFPTDYTRLYLTMTGIRPAFLLLLILFLTLIHFLKANNRLKSIGWMLISILILVVSLLIYEGQIGLTFVVPIILVVTTQTKLTRQKVIAFSGYYLSLGAFVYWKLILQPRIYPDGKIESLLSVRPVEIFDRYLYATRTLLGGFQFPYPDASWLSAWNITLLLAAILGCVGLFMVSIHLFKGGYPIQMVTGREDFFRKQIWIMLAGAILWLGGYIPLILNYSPNIYGHLSRVNLFSIPGAVLIILALLAIFFRSVTSTMYWIIRGVTVTALLLVFLGITIQVQTQTAYNHAWSDSKAFYQQLFARVPNIKEGTQVVFELTGYEDYDGNLYRPVYSSFWEGTCSLGLLYDQDDFNLGVVYRYKSIEVPPFPGLIILPSTLETNTLEALQTHNLEDWLVLRYNRLTNGLSILEELPPNYGDELTGSYQPYDRIVHLSKPLPNRKIVE